MVQWLAIDNPAFTLLIGARFKRHLVILGHLGIRFETLGALHIRFISRLAGTRLDARLALGIAANLFEVFFRRIPYLVGQLTTS